jgi:hypothetical protein
LRFFDTFTAALTKRNRPANPDKAREARAKVKDPISRDNCAHSSEFFVDRSAGFVARRAIFDPKWKQKIPLLRVHPLKTGVVSN